MFTGLIDAVGEVVSVADSGAGRRFTIGCGYPPEELAIGASIACGGACLTVVERAAGANGGSVFGVDVSPETLKRTTVGTWSEGTKINLERSLKLGAELGGHLVTGHIDDIAEIIDRRDEGGTARFSFAAPAELARFIAEKGSVALDGTSLTVNEVDDARFQVMLIPHTLAVTTWGERRPGDNVNLEVDLVARYVARLAEAKER